MNSGRACCLACLIAVAAWGFSRGAQAQVDLTGHWQFDTGDYIDITQSGSSATVCSALYPTCFNGTVSSDGHLEFGDGPPRNVYVTATPVGTHLDGWSFFYPAGPLGIGRFFITRCECFDGNVSNGDGCDAQCRIESCFSCSGDPSVCTPLVDGNACDDRNQCTSGETCSAGVCGGGTPITPCVNLTGRWLLHYDAPPIGLFDRQMDILQEVGVLLFRIVTDGQLDFVGPIDAATGGFSLRAPNTDNLCALDGLYDTLSGAASADGSAWSGSGVIYASGAVFCGGTFPFDVTATRCGGGTLDPGEECDDGNTQDGDGCSALCQIEPVATPTAFATPTASPTSTPSPLCPPVPRGGCRQAPRSTLIVRQGALPSMNKLLWAWAHGDATDAAALGDPVSGTTDYGFCVYGSVADAPYLALQLHVPAGGSCGGTPCWSATGTSGLRYQDRAATADGVTALRLRSGASGAAKIRLQAHGTALPMVLPADAASLIAADPQVLVQLVNTDGSCWEAAYTAAQSRVSPTRFSGRF